MKVGIDPLGGSFVTLIGRMPLMSVPFALYAKTAGNTLKPGNGISISNDSLHNTAPDQTVTLTGSGNVTVTGTYPNFTIDGTKTLYHAGTGITISGDTIYNTAAQVPVNITGQGIQVSGSHPSFTLTAADSSPTNELQALSLSNDTLYLSNGGSVYVGMYLDNTDTQTLSGSHTGSIVTGSISGGNSISFSVDDDDADSTNELQVLSLANDTLWLSNGNYVLLGSYRDNTDAQQLSKTGKQIDLQNSGNITLNDDDSTNELQAISKTGKQISLDKNGGNVMLNDDDSMNELQQLSLSSDTLWLNKNGGFAVIPKIASYNNYNEVDSMSGSLASGLIAYYPFNGDAKDYSGNGHHGTTINYVGDTLDVKKFLNTDRFGRKNQSLFVNMRSSTGGNYANMLSAIKIQNDSQFYPLDLTFSYWDYGSTVYNLFDASSYIIKDKELSRPASSGIGFDNLFVKSNKWTHHVITFKKAGLSKLYIDGILVDEKSSALVDLGYSSSPIYLAHQFIGKLDDVAIFNRALNDTEVIQLYRLGNYNGDASTSVVHVEVDDTNELQTLSIDNDTLTLSKNGGSIKLPNNFPSPTDSNQAANAKAIQYNLLTFGNATLSGTTYSMSLAPAISHYQAGMLLSFIADSANTGAVSLNVNGLGAMPLKKLANQDLQSKDILAGQVVMVLFDGNKFQLLSAPSSNINNGGSDTKTLIYTTDGF